MRVLQAAVLIAMLAAPAVAAIYYIPPETIYKDIHPVCDLDGDGIDDLLVNEYQTPAAGEFFRGDTRIVARSGADGSEIWRGDGLFFQVLQTAHGFTYLRPGLPDPQGPRNVIPAPDITGDGVCDIYTWGLQGRLDSISTPVLGSPGLSQYDVRIRLIDGATGNESWTQTFLGRQAHVSERLFDTLANEVTLNYPTDLRIFHVGNETRLLLKTTDVVYNHAEDVFGLTGNYLEDPFWFVHATTADHYSVLDERGNVLWTRDFQLDLQADETNITWISGLADVTGDGSPDILLDQMWLNNPRGSEMEYPDSDERVYKNGRGMRVLAIATDTGREGEVLWSRSIHDPLAVQPRADNEEGLEILAWTHARIIPDVDGDGAPELAASWLGMEEMAYASHDGKRKTHFVPVSGATGQILWEAVVQGWGFLHDLSQGNGTVLAGATVDLPEAPGPGQGYPEKGVRIAAFDGATGENLWTREQPFSQDSQASYHLAQWQWDRALALQDVNGDGVLDPIMPPRLLAPFGPEQAFLATARQAFDRLDGRTGELVDSLETWGSNGLLADCGDGVPTAFVGHSKRLDVVRWEAGPQEPSLRQTLMSTPEARSSLAGIDLVSLGADCSARPDGVLVWTNMERFSLWRQFEIFPTLGLLDATGLRWLAPDMQETPPNPGLLEQASAMSGRFIEGGADLLYFLALATIIGAAAGWMVAGPLRRRREASKRAADPLGIMLVLLFIPPFMLGGAESPDVPDVELPEAPPMPAPETTAATPAPHPAAPPRTTTAPDAPTAWPGPMATDQAIHIPGAGALGSLVRTVTDPASTPDDVAQAYYRFHAATGTSAAELDPRFEDGQTFSFPHPVGDMDGDGVDDVAVDIYCMDRDACLEVSPGILGGQAFVEYMLSGGRCGAYHAVIMVSGATGTPLWAQDLVRPHPSTVWPTEGCSVDVLVGAVQTEEGDALLALRYELQRPALLGQTLFDHTVYLMDAATGTTRWEQTFKGSLTDGLLGQVVGETIAVKPLLATASPGVPDLTGIGENQLLLQGIGFVLAETNTLLAPPGASTAVWVSDAYYPKEWLARVDLDTGDIVYQVDTLLPQPGRSVMPWTSLTSPFLVGDYGYIWDYPYDVPPGHIEMQWSSSPCCPDLDGDGVPDLATITREWQDVRNGNTDEDEGLGTRVMAWSGQDGTLLFDQVLIDDVDVSARTGRSYYLYRQDGIQVDLKPAGDVDGDGGIDLIAQVRVHLSDYEDHLFVLDGDGGILWSNASPRYQEVAVLGDTDGDGGDDLLFAHWWERENRQRISGDGTNVTARGLRILDGDTGDLLRVHTTYAAPYDIVTINGRLAAGGFPDLDGDGVGDFPVDDPVFLPDEMTVHDVTWISGASGKRLLTTSTVGAFVMPHRLPDHNGDGRDDLAYLVGDPNDLWLVYVDGKTGDPMWSHRALAIESSSYAWILPKLRFWEVDAGGASPGLLVNIHMEVTTVVGELIIYYVGDGPPVRELMLGTFTVPQMIYQTEPATGAGWSHPDGGEFGLHDRSLGSTPGTELILNLRERAEPTPMDLARDAAREGWPIALALVASFGMALGLGVFLPRRSA